MNFDFSEDQKLLRAQAARFLNERSSLKAVRRCLESGEPQDSALWRDIAALGWQGAVIPESHGGLGLTHLELCVIAEELGRALACTAFGSSVYLASEALMIAGSQAQKAHWLPKLAKGEAIGTLAWTSSAEGYAPVSDGLTADFCIVLTQDPEPSLSLVDLKGAGVSRELLETIDPTRSAARIRFSPADAEPLGRAGEGRSLLQRVLDRAAVLMAFEQVGGAQACLDMARSYALSRYAFGRQIGSFQAIKHRLVDIYVAVELARSNAYYGAWALSTDAAELPVAAAGARVAATQAFELASKENIQIHGGIGFTWEADSHLFYRRSKWLAHALGTSRVWKDRLIQRLERRNAAA